MRIKVTERVLDYDGNPIQIDDKGNFITIRSLILDALAAPAKDEVLTGEHKAKMYMICTKVVAGKEVDLKDDARSFIKERAAKTLFPMFYGRLSEALESKDPKPTEEAA